MKLNLGCGTDLKNGYENVDFRDLPGVFKFDLSNFPWPWADNSIEEILMLDCLEHFPYKLTQTLLSECWRILKVNGFIDIQVPDFTHSAMAVLKLDNFLCNRCEKAVYPNDFNNEKCNLCGQFLTEIQDVAIHRLYGGQDYQGNFHHTSFTQEILERFLTKNGFGNFELLEKEHMWKNWTLKIRAYKLDDPWKDE